MGYRPAKGERTVVAVEGWASEGVGLWPLVGSELGVPFFGPTRGIAS